MHFTLINTRRLRADMASLASECTDLKRALRQTWTLPMADEQRRLCRRRRHLTELHVLFASLRGRFHVTRPPRDVADWDQAQWHARIAARVGIEYAAVSDRAEALS
jgi:hypothetical protein